MPRVFVSIGSNIEREHYIRAAIAELRARFGELQLSSVYESEAVGFAGDNFYNLVAAFDSGQDVHAIVQSLREIEQGNGRSRSGKQRFASRTLDIDLLLYGDLILEEEGLKLPRTEITHYAFALRPLAEIAPDAVHPTLGQTYQTLWQAFDGGAQLLWPVMFEL